MLMINAKVSTSNLSYACLPQNKRGSLNNFRILLCKRILSINIIVCLPQTLLTTMQNYCNDSILLYKPFQQHLQINIEYGGKRNNFDAKMILAI